MGLLCVGVSCAHNVPQDKASTEDGKIKGAKTMVLEEGEAKATGIVTYPGGDRVDWKLIELPDKKRGTLDVSLSWTAPRPGLQLGFDVFDEWNTPVLASKVGGKSRKSKSRSASLAGAKGKYFVRVFAVGRGDAGKYRLKIEFKEDVVGPGFDALKLDIPDPPKLAAVPENEVGCDEFAFDPKLPACKAVCPASGAPPGWPACKGKCPTPPDVNEPACWATMPCPKGQPDEKIKACQAKDWPPCPDKKNPDLSNPNCRVPLEPIMGRIVGKEVKSGGLVITIGAGADQGVQKTWKGMVVRGPDVSDKAVAGGEVVIVRVDKSITVGQTKLSADQITSTPYVKFTPPPLK